MLRLIIYKYIRIRLNIVYTVCFSIFSFVFCFCFLLSRTAIFICCNEHKMLCLFNLISHSSLHFTFFAFFSSVSSSSRMRDVP